MGNQGGVCVRWEILTRAPAFASSIAFCASESSRSTSFSISVLTASAEARSSKSVSAMTFLASSTFCFAKDATFPGIARDACFAAAMAVIVTRKVVNVLYGQTGC